MDSVQVYGMYDDFIKYELSLLYNAAITWLSPFDF